MTFSLKKIQTVLMEFHYEAIYVITDGCLPSKFEVSDIYENAVVGRSTSAKPWDLFSFFHFYCQLDIGNLFHVLAQTSFKNFTGHFVPSHPISVIVS